MPDFLGIDTSNYTTSAAIFRSEENRIIQVKKLLKGEPLWLETTINYPNAEEVIHRAEKKAAKKKQKN